MKIEPAEKKDLFEISQLAKDEFSYAGQSQEKLEERRQRGVFIFKAYDNEKILGFVDFEVKGEESIINAIAVKKEFRGKNIGKTLCRFAINFLALQGTKKIILLVKHENETAKKIYESLGFTSTGIYEKKIEEALVEKMELEIRENQTA